nr:BTB/POZ and MATH domain-containing protein 2-like [Lolium perenne]
MNARLYIASACILQSLQSARTNMAHSALSSPFSPPGRLVEVPPSNIGEQLLRLLESKEGADVTFLVGSLEFAAHTLVLSARSPVFRETFFQQKQQQKNSVRVDGVGEAAFAALLHFAYADALPATTTAELLVAATGDAAVGARMEAAGDLIAAANRYGMDRMRLLCERALCEAIVSADAAAATLGLAVRLRSAQLKAFCVDYLASPGVLKAMMGTDAYVSLKELCPDVLVEIMEKVVTELLLVQANGNGNGSSPAPTQRPNHGGRFSDDTCYEVLTGRFEEDDFVHELGIPCDFYVREENTYPLE